MGLDVNLVWVVAMAVALGTPADAQKEARDLLERGQGAARIGSPNRETTI